MFKIEQFRDKRTLFGISIDQSEGKNALNVQDHNLFVDITISWKPQKGPMPVNISIFKEQTNIHKYIYVYICMYKYIYMYIYICMYIDTHINICGLRCTLASSRDISIHT